LPPKTTLFSRRWKYSSSRSKSEDIMLLHSDNEEDEEINLKGKPLLK